MTELAYRRTELLREEADTLGREWLLEMVENHLRDDAAHKGWVIGKIKTRVEDLDVPMFDDLGVIVLDEVVAITVFTSEAPILERIGD